MAPEDLTGMANAIRFLRNSSQRRRELGESTQHRAQSTFSIKSWAACLHAIYQGRAAATTA